MRRKSTRKKETEFEKLARLIKGEGEDIRHEMIKRFDAVSKQFDSTNRRFDAVDEQLREIRTELSDNSPPRRTIGRARSNSSWLCEGNRFHTSAGSIYRKTPRY